MIQIITTTNREKHKKTGLIQTNTTKNNRKARERKLNQGEEEEAIQPAAKQKVRTTARSLPIMVETAEE